MSVIYEPRGKAREYSELAINLWTGCSHACKYCYCPAILRKTVDEWSKNPYARTRIIQQLERDLKKMTDDDKQKELLFSFMTDPYQSDECAFMTRQALLLCEHYELKNVQVLTKAGFRAVKDFDIIKRNGWKFASTIIFRSESLREIWEPGATSIASRIEAVKIAHAVGIETWISIEPVVDAGEALKVIEDTHKYVDLFKVGKMNHNKEVESKIDWNKFYIDSVALLNKYGKRFYIKKDLLKFA